MPKRAGPALCLLLSTALLLTAGATAWAAVRPDPAGSARGPWYTDLDGHWAKGYIRTLWREGVTPPPLYVCDPHAERWTVRGPFCPNSRVRPQTFGDMLLRVFAGEPFPPPAVAVALAGSGDSFGVSGAGAWHGPVPGLLRQEAVAVLVEALGLRGFAEAMDPAQAAAYLDQFRDGRSVAPAYRRTMALAIRLGIIQGYPDRTILPRNSLSRAEAATVIYRSCLLLAEADPNPFSPDGDGAEDETTILLGSLLNRNALGWAFFILDSRERVLRNLTPARPGAEVPPALIWDGRDDRGRLLTPGVYYYRGWLRDRDGNVHWSALKPIVLEAKALQGFVHPSFVLPGGTVVLSARSAGGPSRVTASLSSFPEAGRLELDAADVAGGRGPGPGREWRETFTVPAGASPGPCLVTFTAWYPSSTRQAMATFEVGCLTVDAELDPNPVKAGRAVTVAAWPSLSPDGCVAVFSLPGGNLPVTLARAGKVAGRETWRGSLVIPTGTPPGRYGVTVTARLGGAAAHTALWLEVTSGETGLTFILSD